MLTGIGFWNCQSTYTVSELDNVFVRVPQWITVFKPINTWMRISFHNALETSRLTVHNSNIFQWLETKKNIYF